MKRKIVLTLMICLMGSVFCFAQSVEIGGSGFVASSEGINVFGGGLNAAVIGYFTDIIGYGIYGNIMYGTYEGVSVIPTDLLIGPVFRVINKERFSLPIGAGFYMISILAFGEEAAARGFNVGAGGNITAEIKFSKNMHLYLRLQGAYEFLGEQELMITPSVGIGF
jgi:hypothetical protein